LSTEEVDLDFDRWLGVSCLEIAKVKEGIANEKQEEYVKQVGEVIEEEKLVVQQDVLGRDLIEHGQQ
jgi:hypothetical protein